ncbi:MAG TPA: hypothetical protein VD902_04145 [Symbiobacteriaceae bacterium]|nr:hypothetical protein [Symbiobacteriaceae bacterium]
MRVALLAGSGLYASKLEEYVEAHPEAGITIVWAVTEPGAVLASLDHDPEVFLLDMRWRHEALEAARLLKEAGVPLIIGLFEWLDDTLIPAARSAGVEVVQAGTCWGTVITRIKAAG